MIGILFDVEHVNSATQAKNYVVPDLRRDSASDDDGTYIRDTRRPSGNDDYDGLPRHYGGVLDLRGLLRE